MATVHSSNQLYQEIIGVEAPWEVTSVTVDKEDKKITVRIEYDQDEKVFCPICAQNAKRYDLRAKTLRHLDTCQYETLLLCQEPRVTCESHKIEQLQVPFAEKHSRFTNQFEAAVLESIKNTKNNNLSKVGELFNLSWYEVNRIKERAEEKLCSLL